MRYALITGASGGIGEATAKQLAKDGCHLYLHYHQNEAAIHQLKSVLKDFSVEVYVVQANLATSSGVNDLIAKIDHDIDFLVLNSGNSFIGLMTDMKTDEINTMVQLNVTSPFLLTQALLPAMIRKKHGNVIVISSIWGLTGASCEVLYSMVKGGQNSFVKALAKEVAPSGIRVNGIAPGAIDTKMLDGFSDEEKREISLEIPMRRLGRPSEVAELVGFLMSDQASYLTGQIISINGAWHC